MLISKIEESPCMQVMVFNSYVCCKFAVFICKLFIQYNNCPIFYDPDLPMMIHVVDVVLGHSELKMEK